MLKVTLPSPSHFANFWDPERAPPDYRTPEDFLADVAEILKEEADELEGMGATYLQLDAPHCTMVLDPRYRDCYASCGWPTEQGIELDNRAIGDRAGVTFGFHLCRGNQASRWLVEGGYDAVAERILAHPCSSSAARVRRPALGRLRAAGARADRPLGGPRPGDHQAAPARVGRRPGMQDRGASRYVPLERLAVSPQFGFATSVLGNALTIDDKRAKLRLIAKVARKVSA